jgi:CheY-like chemotaxis protein
MSNAKRILVVEDEPIVALSLQDTLEDLGFVVVGPAFRVASALVLARGEAIDAAILDVNMAGEDSYGIAEALRARGIPYLFATGYGRQGLEAGHEHVPVLQKPYREAQVSAGLAALLA